MKKELIIVAIITPILVLLIIIGHYTKNVDLSMVAGTYIANYDRLKSTLVLKEDGTYDYYLETEDGEKYFNSNIWDYNANNTKSKIHFSEFRYFIDTFNTKMDIISEPLILGMIIYSDYRGRIKMTIDEDEGLYYLKQ